ncbi:MAG: uracil-DNA glycosylase [Pseudomonadota bacterium]
MVPKQFLTMVQQAHPSWHVALTDGLNAVAAADPSYLPVLSDSTFLPTQGRLFAAFALPLDRTRYVLIGEGPYPRAASATGVCFMDGAVGSLWSAGGLSKDVNRATSLRNFMKMLLVAAGQLQPERTTGDALVHVAAGALAPGSPFIQTLSQLQHNLTENGFLLLNAALAFRTDVPPLKEARAWQPFLKTVFSALAQHAQITKQQLPTLVLWGKVAGQVEPMGIAAQFPRAIAEHPYNLSFIINRPMHDLFGPMQLLTA